MARAIWTGSITFGLLNVPVKLYSASRSSRPLPRAAREGRLARPPQARRRGGRRRGRLRGDRQGLRDLARPVRGDQPRGARGARPQEDHARSRSRTSSTSTRSTRSTSTSPTTLVPTTGAEPPTPCSSQAMASRTRSRSPASCCATRRALRPSARWASPDHGDDALRRRGRAAEPARGTARRHLRREAEEQEVEMAKAADRLARRRLRAREYKDKYREELLELIERKAAGQEIVSTETEEPKPTKAPDLMAALEESLAASRARSSPVEPSARRTRPRSRSPSPRKPSRRPPSRPPPRRRASRRPRPRSRDRRPRARRSRTSTRSSTRDGFTKGEVIDYYARIAPRCCRTSRAAR